MESWFVDLLAFAGAVEAPLAAVPTSTANTVINMGHIMVLAHLFGLNTSKTTR